MNIGQHLTVMKRYSYGVIIARWRAPGTNWRFYWWSPTAMDFQRKYRVYFGHEKEGAFRGGVVRIVFTKRRMLGFQWGWPYGEIVDVNERPDLPRCNIIVG